MPENEALWLTAKPAAFEVGPATYTPPASNEVVVRNRAVAINPIDWLIPLIGNLGFPWIKYPFVLGSDVAGEVVEVGAAVSRFAIGDRVLGHAVGTDKARNRSAEGGFQKYTVVLEHMAAPIPAVMAFETAAVVPLGLSTAACGLFQTDQLALRHPGAHPEPAGKTVLVWGGSTSVGSNAIQLAVAAGYDVVTTASPKNFDYVTGLGARAAFDYRSPTVVGDIVAALQGRRLAGALAIGVGSAEACLDVVHGCEGDKFVALATPSVAFDTAPAGRGQVLWLMRTLPRLIASNVAFQIKAKSRGVRSKFIFGSSLLGNEVGPMIYVDFLPAALAEGRYRAAPEPLVVGDGLEAIRTGLEVQRRGVSAEKVVVSL